MTIKLIMLINILISMLNTHVT